MLLRDDRLVALDGVVVTAKRAADAYEDASLIAQDEPTTALFERLSRRRDEMAEELEPFLVELGDLPSDPDVEGETVGQVWRRLKSVMTADQRLQLLTEAAAMEAQLATCIDAALGVDLPAAAIARLRDFRDEVENDRRRLLAADVPG